MFQINKTAMSKVLGLLGKKVPCAVCKADYKSKKSEFGSLNYVSNVLRTCFRLLL
jgi:hypothetical protein